MVEQRTENPRVGSSILPLAIGGKSVEATSGGVAFLLSGAVGFRRCGIRGDVSPSGMGYAPPKTTKLIPRVRQAARLLHYSRRTEEAYVGWIRRFVLFSGARHADDLGVEEVRRFFAYLAVERKISAATQNQALAALVFLYRRVLERQLEWLGDVARARQPVRLPVVLSRAEVAAVIRALTGPSRLVAILLYGSGLRLMEALTLRIKDLDFARRQIVVRRGKGGKDRVTMLPDTAIAPLAVTLRAYTRFTRAT